MRSSLRRPNPGSAHLPCAPPAAAPILLLRALRLHHLKPLEDLWRQEWEQLPPFVRVHPAVSAGRRGASSRHGHGWLQAGFPCEAHRATNWHKAPQATEETNLGGCPCWRPTKLGHRRLGSLQTLLCQLQHLQGIRGHSLPGVWGTDKKTVTITHSLTRFLLR